MTCRYGDTSPRMLDPVDIAAAAIVLCIGVLALLSGHSRFASALTISRSS
jgi:hypothetical protein